MTTWHKAELPFVSFQTLAKAENLENPENPDASAEPAPADHCLNRLVCLAGA